MKDANGVRTLVKKLSKDPQVKQAIAQARRRSRSKNRAEVEGVTNMLLLALAVAARFSKKKKARALDDLGDLLYVLVQASLLLKENIFDRPEVKKFFSKSSKQLYALAEGFVAMISPKTKQPGTVRSPRPV